MNLAEGAMGGYHTAFKIPTNPWGAFWTGVSSSGSGVATAAGLCFASIGTDTGGSIRYPSLSNGIVGLKPSFGLVSRYGVMPLSKSLDHVGPMARARYRDKFGHHFGTPADFAGIPSLALPCGKADHRPPNGLQIMGGYLKEAIICRIGYAYEKATNWHEQHPNI